MFQKCRKYLFVFLCILLFICGMGMRGESKVYTSQAYASTRSDITGGSFANYIEKKTTNCPDSFQLKTKYQKCNSMLRISHWLSLCCFICSVLLLILGLFSEQKFMNYSCAFFLLFAVVYVGSSCIHGLTIQEIRDQVSDREWYMEFVQE